jgi:hypothetical protein
MKFIYILLIMFISLQADEIQRIESIVKDIVQLREQYDKCEEQLALQEKSLSEKEKHYIDKIKTLENRIQIQEKALKNKDIKINNLKNRLNEKPKPKEITVKTLVNQKCEPSNPFPKLMMKEQYKEGEIFEIQATTFRLHTQADIYNTPHGEVIARWEDGRSFTSNTRTKNWIKITGYFVDKVWQATPRDMWVDASDATQR